MKPKLVLLALCGGLLLLGILAHRNQNAISQAARQAPNGLIFTSDGRIEPPPNTNSSFTVTAKLPKPATNAAPGGK
jgi:hypothetical protein